MKENRLINRVESPRRAHAFRWAGPMISAAFAVAVLSGCAPVINPVTVVSLIFDGISYATTGKGPADHIISGVTDRDCAMYRGLFDEPVCEPNDANIGPADEAAAPDTFEAAMQAPPVYLD
tara:strand:- start:1390 stop:1752 length:363 start_codon:yes stop_codon:yes gene_type:complete